MKTVRTLCLGLLLLSFAGQAFPVPDGPQAEPQKKSVELRKELVKVNYIQATQAYRLLIGYKSNLGTINFDESLQILTIQDIPEIVEKMLDVLKAIDVRPADLRFAVDLVLGSVNPPASGEEDKDFLKDPIVRELKNLTKYSHFRRLDSTFIRTQDMEITSQKLGGENMSFRLELRPRYIREDKAHLIDLELALYRVLGVGKESSSNLLRTSLSLKNGERTVVGVSKLDGGDYALILIISGALDD